jgi:Asp-tRNA(Asn)/Glu-tRNA(Gln) amidotransferase A subunit family amidase
VRGVVKGAVELIDGDLGGRVEQVELTLPDAVEYFMDWWGPYAAAAVAETPELADDFLKRPSRARYLKHGEDMTATDLMRVQHETRNRLHRAFAEVFLEHDLLVWPTTTTTAFPHPGKAGGPTTVDGQRVEVPSLENQRFTEAISHACYPAITVPAGFTDEGLPVGLQIAGGHGRDAAVLRAAAAFEEARPWAQLRPAL